MHEHAQGPRLIILLPGKLAGSLTLARDLYWMAARGGYDLLYLVLLDDPSDSLTIERSMTTMQAFSCGNHVRATSRLIPSAAWFDVLNATYNPGDLIVSLHDQVINYGLLRKVSMVELLQRSLNAPVLTLPKFYTVQANPLAAK